MEQLICKVVVRRTFQKKTFHHAFKCRLQQVLSAVYCYDVIYIMFVNCMMKFRYLDCFRFCYGELATAKVK